MSTKSKLTLESSARLQEDDALFRLQLSHLKNGAATESGDDDGVNLLNVEDQGARLVASISRHLSASRLTTTMIDLLCKYLARIDTTQQRALLGLSQAHRRSSALGQRNNAIDAYTRALGRGLSSEDALMEAYDAYFAAMPLTPGEKPNTYDRDRVNENDGRSRHTNQAKQRMATLIKPCLVKAGVLLPSLRGRPKKALITTSTAT